MFYFGMTIETAIWLTSKEFILGKFRKWEQWFNPRRGQTFFQIDFPHFFKFPGAGMMSNPIYRNRKLQQLATLLITAEVDNNWR